MKPGNILLKERNNINSIVISDFGLAVHLSAAKMHSEERCGTLLYSSPE
jgi:serine/threonine protein kinase